MHGERKGKRAAARNAATRRAQRHGLRAKRGRRIAFVARGTIPLAEQVAAALRREEVATLTGDCAKIVVDRREGARTFGAIELTGERQLSRSGCARVALAQTSQLATQARAGLIERIQREAEHAEAGRPARIRFKTNHLVDEATSDALYRASRAGVQIDLLVRTFCTIRAGVPGLTENIRVRSVLGRFL